jgi:Kdo2-lipid IVA lauroyltransferase/acyltransferase
VRARSGFRNWIEYVLALAVLKSLARGPLPLANALARVYVRLLDLTLPRLRRIAFQNLAFALPERSAEHECIVGEVFHSIARLLVAFSRFPTINRANLAQWIHYEGYEHYEEALRQGKGILFATAHLGNWELSAFAHALLSAPMHVVARPLDNPLIDAVVERYRTGSGNRLIYKKDLVRSLLQTLRANEAVGILVDQNAAAETGVFVDFFGVPACANTGFAKIAAHSGATVIPGFAIWSERESKYVLRFYPPIPMTGQSEADTAAVQKQLELVIREYPGQWLWIHRRWKTRPPGEAPLYG